MVLCRHVNLAIRESYVVILILFYEEVRKIYDQTFREKDTQFYPDWTTLLPLVKKLRRTAPQLYKWRKEFDEFGEGDFPVKEKLKLTPEQEKIHELEKKTKRCQVRARYTKKHVALFPKEVNDL